MKKWTEGKAALAAMTVSATALLSTFGFAWLMRHADVAMSLPDLPQSAEAKAPLETLTQVASDGRHLFLMNCAHCHGEDARGDEGPDLHDLHRSDARIHDVITAGIKGEMPSFGKKLTDPDVRALTAYLRTLRG
jgi:mono/diheme cytochrome c family protein